MGLHHEIPQARANQTIIYHQWDEKEDHVIRLSYLLDRMTCVLCEFAIQIVLDTNKLVCFIFYIISLQIKVRLFRLVGNKLTIYRSKSQKSLTQY